MNPLLLLQEQVLTQQALQQEQQQQQASLELLHEQQQQQHRLFQSLQTTVQQLAARFEARQRMESSRPAIDPQIVDMQGALAECQHSIQHLTATQSNLAQQQTQELRQLRSSVAAQVQQAHQAVNRCQIQVNEVAALQQAAAIDGVPSPAVRSAPGLADNDVAQTSRLAGQLESLSATVMQLQQEVGVLKHERSEPSNSRGGAEYLNGTARSASNNELSARLDYMQQALEQCQQETAQLRAAQAETDKQQAAGISKHVQPLQQQVGV